MSSEDQGRELVREKSILLYVKAGFAIVFSVFLLSLTVKFMNYSIGCLARETPYVTAGIMSALFALLTLTGAIMVARDWLLSLRAEKPEKPE